LLLACQFNFRQKTWSLPLFRNPQDAESELRFFAREFPGTFFSETTDFSDPSMGGATPMKPLFSRGWNPAKPAFGKTQTTNQKKK
jgi:hypothetical protein